MKQSFDYATDTAETAAVIERVYIAMTDGFWQPPANEYERADIRCSVRALLEDYETDITVREVMHIALKGYRAYVSGSDGMAAMGF